MDESNVAVKDEKALVCAVQNGDVAAFEGLLDAHLDHLRAFIALKLPVAHLVNDIAHETFVFAYRNIARFELGTSFRAWLRAIAANLIRAELQRFRREETNRLGYARHQLLEQEFARAGSGSLEAEHLEDCVRKLPPTMRGLIALKYEQELPIETVSERRNRPAIVVPVASAIESLRGSQAQQFSRVITDDQLIAYVAGQMLAEESVQFEEELAADAPALQRFVDQERIDAALACLCGSGERVTVREGILEIALGVSAQQIKTEVLAEVRRDSFSLRAWFLRQWPAVAAAAALVAMSIAMWTNVSKRPANVTRAEVRDPVEWPFAAESPWNTPIGDNAQFEEVRGIDLSLGAYIADARVFHPVYHVAKDDPIGRIHSNGAREVITTRIPKEALDDPISRLTVHLVSGFEVIELTDVKADAGDLFAAAVVRGDLRGSGIPFEFASANASGLTSLAGSLRGDLSGGIWHALGAVVPAEVIVAGAPGFVWPAGWAPTNAAVTQYFNRGGNIQFGSLLAIPPEVDLTKLGIATNSVAFQIARAMQDYGVYVKDIFVSNDFLEWQRAGSPHLLFCGDLDWERMPSKFREDLARATRELRLVTNNGPQNVGGGGTRRRPPAPNFIL